METARLPPALLKLARQGRDSADRLLTVLANASSVRKLIPGAFVSEVCSKGDDTNVVLPAAFGSMGDEALSAGTIVGATALGMPIRMWAPGSGVGWADIEEEPHTRSLQELMVGGSALLNRRARDEFGSRDLLVIGADTIGGDYLHGFIGYRTAALSQAVHNGRRAKLVNFSFGSHPTSTAVSLLRSLPEQVELWARDSASRERAANALDREIGLAPDIGALTRAVETAASEAFLARLVGKQFVVLVPNAHFATKGWLSRAEVVRNWVELAVKLGKTYSVVILPHDVRKRPGDVALANEITNELVDKVDVSVFVPSSAGEAKRILEQSAAVVSARMHACVGALSSGVPCIGIEYLGKFIGQFEWYGHLGSVIPLNESANSEHIVDLVEAHVADRKTLSVQVSVDDFGWLTR